MRDFEINCIGFPYSEKYQKEQKKWSQSLKHIKDLSDLLRQPEAEARERVEIIGELQNHLNYIGIELASQLKLIENLKMQMEIIDADRVAQLRALEGLSIRQNAWFLAKRLKKIIGLGRK